MVEFKLPDLGEGITEAEIIAWEVKEGDVVAEHQPLAQVETDKAIVSVPSPKAGTVAKIHHAAGDTVRVGEVLVSLETGDAATVMMTGSTAAVGKAEAAAETNGRSAHAEEDAGTVVGRLASDDGPRRGGDQVLATPAVRRLARKLGVELERVAGTGLSGRITEADVRKIAEGREPQVETLVRPISGATVSPAGPTVSAPAPATAAPATSKAPGGTVEQTEAGPVERRPLRGVRKAIVQKLTKAARTIVPVTHMDECDVTELVRIKSKEDKAAREHGDKLTYLPFIIKAVIQGLREFPQLNATLDEEHEEIVVRRYFNIGIAVDTADGLMVPVIKNADRKSMLDIGAEIQRLADAAHNRRLALSDLRGGTFTITNIGVIGGTYATPIANYPEVAILAVGRIRDRVTVIDGQIVVRKMVGLSLTFDHRLIDGGDGARFVNTVIRHVEDPDLLLIKACS